MANIEKRITSLGKVTYRAKIRLKGHPQLSATFPNKSKAKEWVQLTEAAIKEGRYFKTIESKKHTFSELLDRYLRDVLPLKPKSYNKQKAQILWWKNQLGSYLLADITPAMIAEKRDLLLSGITVRGKKRSNSTTVRYMAVLSHVFTVAVREWGWLNDSPMRKVTRPKESRGRVRFLDEDERVRLLEACKESKNPYLYAIVILGISTGMRKSEILGLKWENIDFNSNRIILHETKNSERRVVPLVGLAKALLEEIFKSRKLDAFLVFSGKKPNKSIEIRGAWGGALKKANIKNFVFHDLRHTAASYLAMNKATLGEIAEILGHKTLSMVKRYAHLSESHSIKVVSSMNEKIFGS
ncbi:MAG: integrase [Chlamydiae bacterium CG10_big_fil_rev_8_21_14_0_10_35_9]|nr:MAG: integrase [Chlamydiae bacterium CG10_big_fil_rev_8_21_14_0_10_35_9]